MERYYRYHRLIDRFYIQQHKYNSHRLYIHTRIYINIRFLLIKNQITMSLLCTSSISFILLIINLIIIIPTTLAIPSIPPQRNKNSYELETVIKNAILKNIPQTIHIEPKDYVFSNVSLQIFGAKDLHIDGNGANLIFYYGFGVNIVNSNNCTFNGFTLDSNPPNFAQGIVSSIDSNSFIAKFSQDFIPPDVNTISSPFHNAGGLDGAKVAFWNETTKYMQPLGNQFMSNATSLGNYVFKIDLAGKLRGNILTGITPVTIFPRRGYTWNIMNSSKITTENVTIHAGGNMGFHESFGKGGNIYNSVAIKRRAGSNHLLALNADGFHSSCVEKGPTLQNSEISFTGDDFLNIHNRMLIICKSLDLNTLAIIDPSGSNGTLAEMSTGDTISFFKLLGGADCKNGCPISNKRLGVSVVKQSNLVTDDHELLKECSQAFVEMQKPPYNAPMVLPAIPNIVYKIQFQDAVPTEATATKYNLGNFDNRSSAGSVVINNHFHDGFSRMGLLKAVDLTYKNNIVERANGLYIDSEQEWLEGDLGLHNITVINNTIVDPTVCGVQNLNATECFKSNSNFLQVQHGLFNLTCIENTLVSNGKEKVEVDDICRLS